MQFDAFVRLVTGELLPRLRIESRAHREPVVVRRLPEPWRLVGTGNYAAVLSHPSCPDWVVKVYAPGRPGLREEAEVYRRLGEHPGFSRCLHAGDSFLILQRIRGVTLYECLRRGIRIPEQAIRDVDEALAYARRRGLHPHDVHAKNVMFAGGRGVVADVSDFGKREPCTMWQDLKWAHYRIYRPYLSRRPVPIPAAVLNLIRKGYRLYRAATGSARRSAPGT